MAVVMTTMMMVLYLNINYEQLIATSSRIMMIFRSREQCWTPALLLSVTSNGVIQGTFSRKCTTATTTDFHPPLAVDLHLINFCGKCTKESWSLALLEGGRIWFVWDKTIHCSAMDGECVASLSKTVTLLHVLGGCPF